MRWYLSPRIKIGFYSLQLLFSFSSRAKKWGQYGDAILGSRKGGKPQSQRRAAHLLPSEASKGYLDPWDHLGPPQSETCLRLGFEI